MTKILFKPKEIGPLPIKNRVVRSATFERAATKDGRVTEQLEQFYRTLAEGGTGLIITGTSYVHASGQLDTNQVGIDRDELIPGLKKLTTVVHEHGEGCKIAIQLFHCGRQSRWLETTIAPSEVLEPRTNKLPREMTCDEIEYIIGAFAEAGRRAKEAEFDAIQLHGAHGYLLNSFLSPYTNRRTDEYGETTSNRIKFIEEIYTQTRERVGRDFPILIKMNGDDFLEGGINLNESLKIASRLSKLGFDAIEISGGTWEADFWKNENFECRTNIKSREQEAYFLPYAREIKQVIDTPLILVGGIRSLDVSNQLLVEGDADFVSFGRPLIREPDLPNKWQTGSSVTAECISCNGCGKSLAEGSVRCTQLKGGK